MKNRTPKQKEAHKLYMKLYYQTKTDKREKNQIRSSKRGLEKIPCKLCIKHITRINMKRHILGQHTKKKVSKGTTHETETQKDIVYEKPLLNLEHPI